MSVKTFTVKNAADEYAIKYDTSDKTDRAKLQILADVINDIRPLNSDDMNASNADENISLYNAIETLRAELENTGYC